MSTGLKPVLERLLRRENLDFDTMHQTIGAIMDNECNQIETAAFLTALVMKEETEDELAGAAAAMRERSFKIPSSHPRLIDTCGTGGDRMHTFNISTATALVIASAGVPVAKHGNRSVSSSTGSADVLEALGVNIEITPEQAGQCLDEIGISFCYARTFHLAMKNVAPIRQQLGIRTIFNFLGPLTNPAGAQYQLIGASNNLFAKKLAGAVSRLPLERAMVVCGHDQLDEVALWGTTHVWDVTRSGTSELSLTAGDFGLPECDPGQLRVASKEESANCLKRIYAGEKGPARDIVLANAALALVCFGSVPDLLAGVETAAGVIDSGKTQELLNQLIAWTNR